MFARDAFSTRGSAQRRHRNELIFLAPDARRMEELEAAVREYLAWKHIAGRAKALDLTPTQLELATTRRDDASTVVEQRIFTSYIWVMFPDQPHADRPMEVREIKAENQAATLAERVSERLHREGQLAAVHSALRHPAAAHRPAAGRYGTAGTSRSASCGTCTPPTPTCPGCATDRSWKRPSAKC